MLRGCCVGVALVLICCYIGATGAWVLKVLLCCCWCCLGVDVAGVMLVIQVLRWCCVDIDGVLHVLR